jgi:hypothetical protein
MERILINNTWIVMLRFTVVPLTGFEAFGVVSAGATSTYMYGTVTNCLL